MVLPAPEGPTSPTRSPGANAEADAVQHAPLRAVAETHVLELDRAAAAARTAAGPRPAPAGVVEQPLRAPQLEQRAPGARCTARSGCSIGAYTWSR